MHLGCALGLFSAAPVSPGSAVGVRRWRRVIEWRGCKQAGRGTSVSPAGTMRCGFDRVLECDECGSVLLFSPQCEVSHCLCIGVWYCVVCCCVPCPPVGAPAASTPWLLLLPCAADQIVGCAVWRPAFAASLEPLCVFLCTERVLACSVWISHQAAAGCVRTPAVLVVWCVHALWRLTA